MFRTKEKISYPILPPDDRGRARYFHGREEILYNFAATLGRVDNTNGGTIFLVQGSPGAGKTALLYQCRKQAEAYGWETAEIEPEHPWSPDKLQKKSWIASVGTDYGKEAISGRDLPCHSHHETRDYGGPLLPYPLGIFWRTGRSRSC